MSGPGPRVTAVPGEASSPREAGELALWMAELLMNNGAETERVERTLRDAGATLGCTWTGVAVTYDALLVSDARLQNGGAQLREVRPRAVNMSLVAQLSRLNHRAGRGELSARELGCALRALEARPRHYSPWLTTFAVALACAAFCRLFQGDWAAFGATFVASASAMWARDRVARLTPNRLLFTAAAACVAGWVVGALHTLFGLGRTPGAAFVACVLMLVPGVPAINAAQDFIKGHLGVAVARATESALIVLAATLGVLLGLRLAQVQP